MDLASKKRVQQSLPARAIVRRAARIGFLCCVLAIAWLAFTPQPDSLGLGWDKLNHVVAFVVLAMVMELGWPGSAAMRWRLGVVLGYGALIELVQALLPYRQGSMLDFAADALGVAAYLVVSRYAWRLRPLVLPPPPKPVSPCGVRGGRSVPAGSRRSLGG